MQALVFAFIVGVLLFGLIAVSAELDRTQQRWKDQQKKYEQANQAIVMLAELHAPIAQIAELALAREDVNLVGLAWEVLQRHQAACEFARGNRV